MELVFGVYITVYGMYMLKKFESDELNFFKQISYKVLNYFHITRELLKNLLLNNS